MRTETKVLIAMRKDWQRTQKEMATIFGWSSSQLWSNLERGKCGFPPDSIPRLRTYFTDKWAERIIRAKVKDFEQQLRGMSR